MKKNRSKTSAVWMREHVSDVFVHRAKKEGYRSRAAYKLLEIDAKDHLLFPGARVVDLGSAPGSWSQVAAAKVGKMGKVIAVDILPMEPLKRVEFIHGNFMEEDIWSQLENCLALPPLFSLFDDFLEREHQDKNTAIEPPQQYDLDGDGLNKLPLNDRPLWPPKTEAPYPHRLGQ